MRHLFRIAAVLLCALATSGCAGDGGDSATPTPSPSPSPTRTHSPLPTATNSPLPTATHSPVPTATLTPLPTSSPTATVPPSATPTATSVPSATATPVPPTSTASPTATASASPTLVPSVAVDPSLLAELNAVGLGKYLGRNVPVASEESGWQRFDFPVSDDGPICLYGTPYRVYVRPGTSANVLFYLEGGGACWNDANCLPDTGAKQTSDPLLPLPFLRAGVFDKRPTYNPFHDWSIVFAMYCDGSVFTGDHVPAYPNGRVYHRGLSNLTAAVDVMRANFPEPGRIVVSGSSAGGFGTFFGYGVMRLAYPEREILVLNDSGPGVQNNDDPRALADRRENWRFEQFRPASCTDCAIQPAYITNWAIERDPGLRASFFSSLQDEVIRGFLEMSGPAYETLLLGVTDAIVAKNPDRLKRYMPAGEFHTILMGGGIGSSGVAADFRTLAIGDTTFPRWLHDFIDNRPGWVDLVEGH